MPCNSCGRPLTVTGGKFIAVIATISSMYLCRKYYGAGGLQMGIIIFALYSVFHMFLPLSVASKKRNKT